MPDPLFSLVIPTYNEAENLPPLLAALRASLAGTPHEVLIVDDDSPDRTWEVAGRLAASEPPGRVRVVRRQDAARGLSLSVVEGFSQARGEWLGVMDADLSHDPALWPRLLDALRGGAELAVGSRRVPGGGAEERWPWHRRFFSGAATFFSRTLLGVPLHDPMSGFFAVRREAYERGRPFLKPRGYKILLDVLVKSRIPAARVVEVPFVFKDRTLGQSKLTPRVAAAFLGQALELVVHRGRRP